MIVEALYSWLRQRWENYEPIKHIEGTYGLVFILEARETDVSPRKCCVKTLNPAKLKPGARDLKALFEREMRLWLSIPFHYNVLPALGLEFAPPPKEFADQFEVLPLMRMPFCDGSLAAWVKDQATVPPVDRLIALAQACSGLQWLYKHGLQGHGDLKPDNILLSDLRERFLLDEGGFPSKLHPWQARVADLGWADIWSQGGGTYHAWRPYLAPERFRNTVVPEASDIYAFGVIACELFSGVHPAGDFTQVLAKKWRPDKWEAWAASTDRLIDIEPPQLRDLIVRCLSPDPSRRPRVSDLNAALCAILEESHGLHMARQLQVQDEFARALMLASHDSWTAEEMSRVNADQLDASIAQLESDFGEVGDTSSTEAIAKWLERGRSLQRLLLRRNCSADIARVVALAKATLDFLLLRDGELDLRAQVYGKPVIASLAPEEVTFEFANEAFANLRKATGGDEAILEAYRVRLNELFRAAYWSGWATDS